MTRTAELSFYEVFCNPILTIGLSITSKNNGEFGSRINLPYKQRDEREPYFPIFEMETEELIK